MANLDDMKEYCETCAEELELGQIGECDCCQQEKGKHGANLAMAKPIPVVSKPGDYCHFNGRQSLPYAITRSQAAVGLLSVRDFVRRGQGKLTRTGVGQYTLVTFDTLLLNTRNAGGGHAPK